MPSTSGVEAMRGNFFTATHIDPAGLVELSVSLMFVSSNYKKREKREKESGLCGKPDGARCVL